MAGCARIMASQVRTLMDGLGFSHITDGYIEGVWGIYDSDGDGVLDLQEIQDMVEILASEKSAPAASSKEQEEDEGEATDESEEEEEEMQMGTLGG